MKLTERSPIMTEAAERLKMELGMLSLPDRAELAQYLIRSLEQEEEDAEAAWDAELQRRAAEIEGGRLVGRPAAQVFAELREKYS
jgi:putative addiction module component (TIGR02574 family)